MLTCNDQSKVPEDILTKTKWLFFFFFTIEFIMLLLAQVFENLTLENKQGEEKFIPML